MDNVPKSKLDQHQNDSNRDKYEKSLSSIINQEVHLENDENESDDDLSIEELDNRIQIYNNLFLANKINMFNAFQIDLINCVKQMVTKTEKTNFVEISNSFDTISKVFTCRVDDYLVSGNKLVKEFLAENRNKKSITKNETQKKPIRKKLMITTADKLCRKENKILPKINYLSVGLDNDIIDFAKPSRVLINKFYNTTYWPEFSTSEKNDIKENEPKNYVMKNISRLTDLIEKGKICPYFNEFVAECDKNMNNDDSDDVDMNKLDTILSNFNPEISKFSSEINDEYDEPMDININNTHAGFFNNDTIEASNRQINIDSISQTLSIVDSNYSDYSFFDPKRLCKLKCNNHWKQKFKQLIMTSKQKSLHIKSLRTINTDDYFETQIESNAHKEQCNRLESIQCKVDFYNPNLSKILKNIKNNIGKNQCNYSSWESNNNIMNLTNKSETLIKRLSSCKFINMMPTWYTIKSTKLNYLKTNENSIFMLPNQNIDDVLSKETFEGIMDIDHCSINENETRMMEENNPNMDDNDESSDDFEFSNHNPGYIDMYELKKYIINIIKPDGTEVLNITFGDLLQTLLKSLSKTVKKNISVPVVYVALLHLCNEHNLHLENNNNQIVIKQGQEK